MFHSGLWTLDSGLPPSLRYVGQAGLKKTGKPLALLLLKQIRNPYKNINPMPLFYHGFFPAAFIILIISMVLKLVYNNEKESR